MYLGHELVIIPIIKDRRGSWCTLTHYSTTFEVNELHYQNMIPKLKLNSNQLNHD